MVVNKEHVGQYTCQLEETGSVVVTTTINVDVQGVYSVCIYVRTYYNTPASMLFLRNQVYNNDEQHSISLTYVVEL